MNKYVLYRVGELKEGENYPIEDNELVGVEFAQNLDEATENILETIRDDLLEMPQHHGCVAASFAPEYTTGSQEYEFHGVVSPTSGAPNLVYLYRVTEEEQ